ncbi:MAG: hypothetical protein K2Q10_11730 [Rhodospirillales bacterium]|nr:hypothetical protein [Rhodospirillales bacterium]
MASFMIKIAGEGLIAAAHKKADVGPTSGSSVIYEIRNCPDGVTIDDVIKAFKGFKAPAGIYEIDYGSLTATA